ncbi:MAG: LacI family DNA-binding transcriptional regulator [Opitutaceae bacterium]
MKPTRSTPKDRVGLRQIAEVAGVCLMTVSLSLRDSPKISRPTRERIQSLARELGYHPDPEISRLMNLLRVSRTTKGRIGVAVIDFFPTSPFPEHAYHRLIRQGISQRSEELGFTATPFSAVHYDFNLRHLLNVIRTRGIEGVILIPCVGNPLSLDAAASWNGLSVVATTNSILAPRFHSVVPHQFANMMRLIEEMQAAGLRKVGAVFEDFFDDRTAHNFTAALNWHHHGRRILMIPEAVDEARRARTLATWLTKHKPDVVFAQSTETVVRALRRVGRSPVDDVRVIGLGVPHEPIYSYLDERPDLVGAGAVDLIAGMIYYHETGIPTHPRTTMIDGQLRYCSTLAAAG